MALTTNNIALIRALAENNFPVAYRAALASLVEDTSKKNQYFVEKYKPLLLGKDIVGMELKALLPSEVKNLVVGESPEEFSPDRYFFRKEEEAVVDKIIKMRRVADELQMRNISYKNATLLYGESGTGKTTLGRYIAYKCNLPFVYISFASAIESLMGKTAKNIHSVFESCSKFPCVLMLDEIDAIGTKRTGGGEANSTTSEMERTVISLMQSLDRLPNQSIIIGATNRVDSLDPALLRRFSIRHKVENLTIEDRQRLIQRYLKSTQTEEYLSFEDIQALATKYDNPGAIMPCLVQMIGDKIYASL